MNSPGNISFLYDYLIDLNTRISIEMLTFLNRQIFPLNLNLTNNAIIQNE